VVDKALGFSLWLDFVERDYLKEAFPALIEKGIVNGATSNPSIFASAISSSPAYREQLCSLQGKSPKEKYEALAITDIRTAAQALRACYDAGNDGYISIEVDPFLSNDTAGTIAEGERLFAAIGEPNVMVKVPATEAGYEAMQVLMGKGISVNATLVFSPVQAERCLDAMKKGTEAFFGKVDGVISVFVSRFDRLLDAKLLAAGIEPFRTGILNAARIYALVERAAMPNIRTLFASTGVKGDTLPAAYYIRELLAVHSVNTAPLATIEAYVESPAKEPKLPIAEGEIEAYFSQLKQEGIEINEISLSLLRDGLSAFEQAFEEMLKQLG